WWTSSMLPPGCLDRAQFGRRRRLRPGGRRRGKPGQEDMEKQVAAPSPSRQARLANAAEPRRVLRRWAADAAAARLTARVREATEHAVGARPKITELAVVWRKSRGERRLPRGVDDHTGGPGQPTRQ